MKKLSLILSLLLILFAGGVVGDDELKTIDQYIDEYESRIDYEGKRLDIQYLITRKCAAVFDTLREIDIDYEYVDKLIQVSVGFRMMIGGNKPEGLDKTRDEIFEEVEADVEKFKGQYLNHLGTWYFNKDEQSDKNELSEKLFSERFREDLNLCFGVAKNLPKDD